MAKLVTDMIVVIPSKILQKETGERTKSFGTARKGGHLNSFSLGREFLECEEMAECDEITEDLRANDEECILEDPKSLDGTNRLS